MLKDIDCLHGIKTWKAFQDRRDKDNKVFHLV